MVKAVVGANWGDEGKGKITDMLAENADIIVRFQGGSNAGHTIINEYGRFALHLLPSGVFYKHTTSVIGNGVALNIPYLLKEIEYLKEKNVPDINILVSDRAQLVMPYHIDFDTYNQGAQMITFLLTPSTVCLAVPLYKQSQILMKHLDAILLSLLSGCLAGMLSITVLCLLFNASNTLLFSLLPKSITTAIAIGVSELIGGNSTMTVGIVIITGIFGAMIAKTVCHIFKINHPVAIGLALGNSAHAIGTAKAIEFGEIEGAMSSLSIVIAGIFTVVFAPLIASLF